MNKETVMYEIQCSYTKNEVKLFKATEIKLKGIIVNKISQR